MKYPFIAPHRAVWSVSELCQALGVSRSGFSEWHGKSASARERANTRLTGRIRESFEAGDGVYGSPWVWRDRRAGVSIVAGIVWRSACAQHA
jgi:putative transposase